MPRFTCRFDNPGTERKACIKVFLCCQGHAIYRVIMRIESLLKISGMKFEFRNCFHTYSNIDLQVSFLVSFQASFLVHKTGKRKRGARKEAKLH